MSSFLWSPQEIREYADPNSAEFLPAAAGKARVLACRLYSNYPQWTVGTPLDNPIASGLRGFWDDLCRDEPDGIPLPPAPPFAGGQCPCVFYQVTFQPVFRGFPQDPATRLLPGAIGSVVRRNFGGGTEVGFFYGAAGCGGVQFQVILSSSQPDQPSSEIDGKILSVVRQDGQPDTCGNPAPPYPQPPPAPEGDDLVDFPVLPTRPGLPGVIVPVVFLRPTLEVNPTVNINPEVTVNVGGIDVNFNFGGINFNVNPTVVLPTAPGSPALPPNSPDLDKDRPPNLSPWVCPEGFTDADRELLRDIKDCACDEEGLIVGVTLGSGSSGTYTLPANCLGILITLTKTPSGVKAQFGGGNAPNVVFPGWSSYGYANHFDERVPLSYGSAFRVKTSEVFSQFCFTCTYGAEATITAVVREVN